MKTTSLSPEPITIIEISGRFDAHVAPEFVKEFEALSSDETQFLVVNVAEVNFIDSTALAALVRGMKRFRQNSGDLMLVNLQNPVRIIFELTRMDRAFSIFASQEAALAEIRAIC